MPDSRFFQTDNSFSLALLAKQIGCVLHDASQGATQVYGVAALSNATEGELAFLSNRQYVSAFEQTKVWRVVARGHPTASLTPPYNPN